MSREADPPAIAVQVFKEFDQLVSESRLRRIADRILALGLDKSPLNRVPSSQPADSGPMGLGSMGVVIADDGTLRDLNRRHRGLDEVTDVLAFSNAHQGEYYGEDGSTRESVSAVQFVVPPGAAPGLGEVVISYPQAVRQAREAGHPEEKELTVLLAHGILHLLGYDHVAPEEAAVMEARQAEILARVVDGE